MARIIDILNKSVRLLYPTLTLKTDIADVIRRSMMLISVKVVTELLICCFKHQGQSREV